MPFPFMALPAIVSAGSGLYGLYKGITNQPADPREQSLQIGEDLESQYGVDALGGDTMKLFELLKSSPEFAAMMLKSQTGASVLRGATARGLGRTGLGQSGTGAIASGAAASAGQFDAATLLGNLFGVSLQGAQHNIDSRLTTHSFQAQGLDRNAGRIDPFAVGSQLLAMSGQLLPGGGGGGDGDITGTPGTSGATVRSGNYEVPYFLSRPGQRNG